MQAPKHLSLEQKLDFHTGESFIHKPWVIAPSTTTARDGLGPLYNASSCGDCHIRNGRMRANSTAQLSNLVLRLGDSAAGFQLQNRAIPGVEPEGSFVLQYETITRQFSDGEVVTLQKPKPILQSPNKANLTDKLSLRIAPMLSGMNVLESIPGEVIVQQYQAQQLRDDKIKGQISWLESVDGKMIGRFGWKAEVATLAEQVALALHQDMGLTSALFLKQNCAANDELCNRQIHGGEPEVSDAIFAHMLNYVRLLNLPARKEQNAEVEAGRKLFSQLDCAVCHVPDVTIGNNKLRPYSDLLLHDMGEDLADTLPLPNATVRQWRTAPLQGIGIVDRIMPTPAYLHDGRASTLMEAILWHGGEAEKSRLAVQALPREKREQLILFLQSL